MAQLSTIIAELESMTEIRVDGMIREQLSVAVAPFGPRVKAAIMNTPSKGTVPWPPEQPGLRARIAGCVEEWAKIEGRVVTAGVEVNSAKMPSGQKSLPLMLEGVKPWRHPVFGDRDNWVGQESHPYFYGAMMPFGPASRLAIERALDEITAAISG